MYVAETTVVILEDCSCKIALIGRSDLQLGNEAWLGDYNWSTETQSPEAVTCWILPQLLGDLIIQGCIVISP